MPIPWTSDAKSQKEIVRAKAEYLGVPVNETMPLNQIEAELDAKFSENAITKALENTV